MANQCDYDQNHSFVISQSSATKRFDGSYQNLGSISIYFFTINWLSK